MDNIHDFRDGSDDMGVSRVGQEGANAPSWNLKMMTSYVVLLYNALNFSLAPSALVSLAPKFSLNFPKTSKNRKSFHFFALSAQKFDDLFISACNKCL